MKKMCIFFNFKNSLQIIEKKNIFKLCWEIHKISNFSTSQTKNEVFHLLKKSLITFL